MLIKISRDVEKDIIKIANIENITPEQVVIDAFSIYKKLYNEVRDKEKRIIIEGSNSRKELIF